MQRRREKSREERGSQVPVFLSFSYFFFITYRYWYKSRSAWKPDTLRHAVQPEGPTVHQKCTRPDSKNGSSDVTHS